MEQKEKILSKLQDNLLLFGKVVMPNTFYLASPPFHKEIADVLTNPIYRFVNIIAPRGSSKSSLVAGVYVLHHLLFHQTKQKVVILSSRTQYHAVLLLQYIKDIIEYSPHFRALFGYRGAQTAKKWTGTEIMFPNGDAIICKGTGQQIRGLKVGNQRPTLLVVDDPEDENNTKTSEAMEGNLKWLLQSGIPSVDSHHGKVVVIGTPLHERCMVLLLKQMQSWKCLHYKYLNTAEDGSVYSLWPEMRSVETLNAIKADHDNIGRLSVFYKEYQCEVIGDEAQLFSKSDILYYNGEYDLINREIKLFKEDGSPDRVIPVNVFMGVDPASSTSNHADYSAIVPVAVDKDKNRYVLPYFRGRVTPLAVADKILELYKKYKPDKTRIETVGYQEMLREYVRELSSNEGLSISGLESKENPRGAKSNRIESMQPYFKKHKMYILKNMKELEDELLLYPRSKHDDLLDALYYACKLNFIPYEREAPISEMDRFYKSEYDWMLA